MEPLILAISFLYAVASSRDRFGTCARLIVGSVPPLVLLAGYDLATFGTPLPVGYNYSSLWIDVHHTGLVSLTYPKLDALWGITFGNHRGLFFLSPFLLFAVPGYVTIWRKRAHRMEFWVLLLAPVSFLVFNASSAMWQGGFAVGPRYLVPSLPFLALAASVGVASSWSVFRARPLVVVACAWSLLAIWAESIGGQSFPDYSANPLFDLSLPKLFSGDVARNAGMMLGLSGWSSLLPLVLILGIAVLVIIFSSAGRYWTRHSAIGRPQLAEME